MNIGSDRATAFAVISSFEALRAYVPAQAESGLRLMRGRTVGYTVAVISSLLLV